MAAAPIAATTFAAPAAALATEPVSAKSVAAPAPDAAPAADVDADLDAAGAATQEEAHPVEVDPAADETHANEPMDAEIVVVTGEEDLSAEPATAADVEPPFAAHDELAEATTETPGTGGTPTAVVAEVEAALAPSPAPAPAAELPAVILLPAAPTAEPMVDEPIADKPAAGAKAPADALPAVPEFNEAAPQARCSALALDYQNTVLDCIRI